jgi:pimeloyl-ACP methyl ester carboxylesterase
LISRNHSGPATNGITDSWRHQVPLLASVGYRVWAPDLRGYGGSSRVSNLTLRYLPNVSHWVQQEAPDTVNAMIEAWLLGNDAPYSPL